MSNYVCQILMIFILSPSNIEHVEINSNSSQMSQGEGQLLSASTSYAEECQIEFCAFSVNYWIGTGKRVFAVHIFCAGEQNEGSLMQQD